MAGNERQEVLDRLNAYEARIRDLLTLLDGIPLPREKVDEARTQMKAFKEKLDADYHRGSTVSGKATLNGVERAFFQPAIDGAATTIRVRWNSTPSKDWCSELYSALTDIKHFRRDLERQD